jgi:hypothetical protein
MDIYYDGIINIIYTAVCYGTAVWGIPYGTPHTKIKNNKGNVY